MESIIFLSFVCTNESNLDFSYSMYLYSNVYHTSNEISIDYSNFSREEYVTLHKTLNLTPNREK